MAPTDKDTCRIFNNDGYTPSHYPAFSPLVYSIENSLPLVRLGQADKWQPDLNSSPWPKRESVKNLYRRKSWPRPLRWLERLLMCVGMLAPVNTGEGVSRFDRFHIPPRFLRWFVWVQILLGWLLATLFLAGVTGIVRKD